MRNAASAWSAGVPAKKLPAVNYALHTAVEEPRSKNFQLGNFGNPLYFRPSVLLLGALRGRFAEVCLTTKPSSSVKTACRAFSQHAGDAGRHAGLPSTTQTHLIKLGNRPEWPSNALKATRDVPNSKGSVKSLVYLQSGRWSTCAVVHSHSKLKAEADEDGHPDLRGDHVTSSYFQ